VVEPDRAGMTHRRLQHLAKRLERSLLEAGGIEASQTPVLAGGVERIGGRTDVKMARNRNLLVPGVKTVGLHADRDVDHYATNALVTFNTHDLPTFAGWRSYADLVMKRGLGIDPGESDDARWHALSMLDNVLRHHAIDRHDVFAVASFLSRTKSRRLDGALVRWVQEFRRVPP